VFAVDPQSVAALGQYLRHKQIDWAAQMRKTHPDPLASERDLVVRYVLEAGGAQRLAREFRDDARILSYPLCAVIHDQSDSEIIAVAALAGAYVLDSDVVGPAAEATLSALRLACQSPQWGRWIGPALGFGAAVLVGMALGAKLAGYRNQPSRHRS
jgi:hypothetical protein